MSDVNNLDDLDAQIAQLSGIDLSQAEAPAPVAPNMPPVQPVAPVQPVMNQVPVGGVPPMNNTNFGAVPPTQPIPQPFTPENPTNLGVVTNNIVQQPQVNPVPPAMFNQPTSVTGVAPVQPVMNPVQPVMNPVQPVAPVQVTPTNVDYGALNKRPVFVDLNQVTRTRTPFLSVKKGEYARIILFTFNSLKDHIHYIDGLGTIRCLSHYNEQDYPDSFAACCKFPTDDGKPNYAKRRQLMPVLKLPVSPADGKTVVGNQVELKMWNMNILESQAIMQILKDYSPNEDLYQTDLTTFDIMLYKDGSGQYAVNKVNAVPTMRAPFMNQLQAEVQKVTDEFWDIAWDEAAKVVKEEVVLNKLNETIAMQNQVAAAMQNPQQPPTLNQALGGFNNGFNI